MSKKPNREEIATWKIPKKKELEKSLLKTKRRGRETGVKKGT